MSAVFQPGTGHCRKLLAYCFVNIQRMTITYWRCGQWLSCPES
jgi:hypothetical protein